MGGLFRDSPGSSNFLSLYLDTGNVWKKFLLILVFYFAGVFSAVYLLGPADLGIFGVKCSRAEVLAYKVHLQLCKVVEIVDKKASKVRDTTTKKFTKR